jgi:hypothetical protein
MPNRFVILGIHDEDVHTVDGNVARVRMFVGDREIDEDFDLPNIPKGSGIQKNVETYKYFLTEAIEKRMTELEKS